MKNKFQLIILLLALLVAGCTKKVLDKQPIALIVDASFYKTTDDLVKAINAAYDPLGWESSGNSNVVYFNFLYGDIASDDAISGGNGSEARVVPIATFKPQSKQETLAGLSELWKKYYIGIYRCNLVIEKAPLSDAPDNVKNKVTGEAKFLRAYYYFKLVEMFGGVPLVTSVLTPDQYSQPKVPKDVIYSQIETDLKEAASLLPLKNVKIGIADLDNLGRATKGAAQSLLVRVYLFQSKWSDLLPLAQDVIASGVYSLEPVYTDIHSSWNKNGVESIFEIQATDALTTGYERQIEGTFVNKWTGSRQSDIGDFGVNIPSDELVNEFSKDSLTWGKIDPRKKGTIISDKDWVVFSPGDSLQIFVEKDGTPFTPGVKYYSRKYAVKTIKGDQTNGPSDQIIIRYADLLLMAAEAAFNLGDESTAIGYIDQVRARVHMPSYTTLKSVPTGTALRDAIWRERRLELAMEALRFFDLVRQGNTSLIKATAEGSSFDVNINTVFPIPQTEIDLSGGKLVQNPGYF